MIPACANGWVPNRKEANEFRAGRSMNHPHFDPQVLAGQPAHHQSAGAGPVESVVDSEAAQGAISIGALLARAASCLAALLQGPTAIAGLNESRYNVLDALRAIPGQTSTQTDLAAQLLQSESNLSTLLDRMRSDGLISRTRSDRDRRKSLIGLTAAGREALDRADLARSRATAAILGALDERHAAGLREGLLLLLERCELELGISGRFGPAGEPHGREPRPVHLYFESLTG
jgi:DNA-binding MarR family transcriptional regulator